MPLVKCLYIQRKVALDHNFTDVRRATRYPVGAIPPSIGYMDRELRRNYLNVGDNLGMRA